MLKTQGVALITAVLALATACDAGAGAGGEAKGGGQAEPLTLVIETSQDANNPGSQPLAELEKVLEVASDGSIDAQVTYEPHGQDDFPVIDDLIAGRASIAAVPARALSRDVPALSALQAPFLLGSETDLNAVAQDAELVDVVSTALEDAGLVGLALYPDGVRHLFSLDGRPILGPADLRGRTVRGPESEDTAALMETLGAALVSPDNDELIAGVKDGSITAAESSYLGGTTELPGERVATGDVVLYGKFMVVAANKEWYERLSEIQREAVLEASAAATAWSLGHHETEQEEATTFCDAGGKIVKAGASAQDAFADAAAPFVALVKKRPFAADIVARMAELVDPSALMTTPTCESSADTAPPLDADAIVPAGGDLPDGTYRFELTPELLSHYPDGDPAHAGVSTYDLQDGHWSTEEDGVTYRGIYQAEGHDLYWKYYAKDPPPFGDAAKLTWTLDEEGSIHWTQLAPAFQDYIFGVPWTKID